MRIAGSRMLPWCLLLILLSGCQSKSTFIDSMISQIDINCEVNQTCYLNIKDLTDFEWDRMVLYEVGSSGKAVSDALGTEYTRSTDLMSGIVFALDNKIVYEERVPYDPEKPSKLEIYIENESNEMAFDADQAVVQGEKKETDGILYYSVIVQ